jgi:chromosome segregation ATPase
MLVGNLTNDEQVTARLRFNMPWKVFGSYISEEQMNMLVSIVSTGSVRQTNDIANAKKSILQNYQFLQNAKFALDIIKHSTSALKLQLQKNIQENTATLAQRSASLDAVKASYDTAAQSLLELKAQIAGIKQQEGLLNAEIDNKLKLTDTAQRTLLFKDNKKDIATQKADINTLFTKLSVLAQTVNFTPIMVPAMLGDTTTLASHFLGVSNIN